jgi:hypothetical protein
MKRLYAIILCGLFFSACEAIQQDDSPVLATVGNSSLTLNEALDMIPYVVLAQDTVTALSAFTKQWVKSQIAVQHAERIGIHNNPDMKKRIERIRKQLLEDALNEYILGLNFDGIEVTREEAQNYYQAHKEQFILEERYLRFRHITTGTRTEADNANRDLARGVEWEEILNMYSVDPERQLRESNQFWPISMAVENISMLNRYLRVIGLSERSPIHFSGGHYHLVQLIEERPEGDHPDLEWLIPQIEEWLKLEKARRITNSYMRNLYLEADANNEIQQANVSEIEILLQNSQSQ